MDPITVELLTLAKKVDNYAIDATGGGATGTTLWTDTTHYKATVPTGKRWILIGGFVYRQVSSTVEGYIYNAAGNMIGHVLSEAAAAAYNNYPEYTMNVSKPWVLDAGEYIQLIFGTAQSATSHASCVVLEVDV